jgi:predicted outer membrane repeat protein
MHKPLAVTFALCLAALTPPLQAAVRLYVDYAATGGANSGASWANACLNLTGALARAGNDDEIWVAQGVYYPGAARTDSFTLADQRLKIYGGLTNGMTTLAARSWIAYPTILDGNIQQDADDSNNAYHVVKGTYNCLLDGFTIRNGYASLASNDNNYGGGLYMSWAGMHVRNCRFENNYALKYAGGAYAANAASTFTNCQFIANRSAAEGGAATFNGNYNSVLQGCRFEGNTAGAHGGAVYCFNNPTRIEDCTFVTNRAAQNGGAVYHNQAAATGVVTRCRFLGNVAETTSTGGGGVHVNVCAPAYRDCIFVGNRARSGGGFYTAGSTTLGGPVENCLFVANVANSGAGAYINTPVPMFKGCVFAGNTATNGGGGGVEFQDKTGGNTVRNCLFVGNQASDTGGGMIGSYCTYVIENATFAGNRAVVRGGALSGYAGKATLRNAIFWGNSAPTAAEWYLNGGSGAAASLYTVSYTDIQGGWNGSRVGAAAGSSVVNAGSNLNVDPQFAPAETGAWSAAGVCAAGTYQTLLADTGKTWVPGALAGRTVNPGTTQYRHFLVVTNSATTITVWGDCAALAASGAGYQIFDAHLQSASGRWTTSGRVSDGTWSPCIDKGNPASAYTLEPRPNGERINLGAYGNTVQASRSRPPATVIYCR